MPTVPETSAERIDAILAAQRWFFASGATLDVDFRIRQLKTLRALITENLAKIEKALWSDLHKSPEETFLTEVSMLTKEIDLHLKNIRRWVKPRRVRTPFYLWPSKSYIHYEPLGVSLIISPWNYPLQLLLAPLIGSISAGGCAVLKPSPAAVRFNRLMTELIPRYFDEKYIALVTGDRPTNEILLSRCFDLIFFTGSPRVGKIVMRAASQFLTPVVLELGGKSPCIADRDASVSVAAKRIIWGKLLNAGQTCIAPDYLFVHRDIREPLLKAMQDEIDEMFGNPIRESRFYGRIINRQAMDRLLRLMQGNEIIYGGEYDLEERFLSPTFLDIKDPDVSVMQEEIFGPLLPVLTFDHIDEALTFIRSKEKPLAFYYFGKNAHAKEILRQISSGGACLNDTVVHIANHRLPFGGVGHSGMGKYHAGASFEVFSNAKSVARTPLWPDLPFRYPPYRFFGVVKKLLR